MSKFKENIVIPYSYVTPALLFFTLVIMFPAFTSLVLSFYNFSGFDSDIFKNFVGFSNFNTLIHYKYFWVSLRNTFYFVGSSIVIQTSIALFLAIFIFFGKFKNSVLIRTIIFFPGVLSAVSISLGWRKILEQDGILNKILHLNFAWLSSVYLAIWLVIMVNIWQWVGYNMVIFYAGLQSINIEMLEASDVDGANWGGKIFRIVIPSLIPTIILNVILNLIGSFRVFDIVYVLTKGGPVHNSEVLTTLMYYYSFAANGPNKMGVASSIAFIMFFIMIIFGFLRVRFLNKGKD
ncbi:MAG: sugar ABC transporter permease [Actinobacteria bacterium]|nr:sugar ABC transporter permease [Actinomycetota bacterium]